MNSVITSMHVLHRLLALLLVVAAVGLALWWRCRGAPAMRRVALRLARHRVATRPLAGEACTD